MNTGKKSNEMKKPIFVDCQGEKTQNQTYCLGLALLLQIIVQFNNIARPLFQTVCINCADQHASLHLQSVQGLRK